MSTTIAATESLLSDVTRDRPVARRRAPVARSASNGSRSTRTLDLTVSAVRARLFWLVATCYAVAIFAAPLTAGSVVYQGVARVLPASLALAISALSTLLLFAFVPGVLSLPHQRWIVPAKMPTNVGIRAYFHRRLYGLCWTSLYYNQLVYWLVLSFPLLKIAVFRLFGYRGASRFTVYPDTWIRDLPLLRIGEGAYLSNKATIGTNIIMQDRQIVVDEVEVAAGATIGHLAAIGPGARCEADSQIGVASMVGMRASIGRGAKIGGNSMIDHGACVRAGANIDTGAHVGIASVVDAGVRVPPLVSVARRTPRVSSSAPVANVERSTRALRLSVAN